MTCCYCAYLFSCNGEGDAFCKPLSLRYIHHIILRDDTMAFWMEAFKTSFRYIWLKLSHFIHFVRRISKKLLITSSFPSYVLAEELFFHQTQDIMKIIKIVERSPYLSVKSNTRQRNILNMIQKRDQVLPIIGKYVFSMKWVKKDFQIFVIHLFYK